MSREFSEVAVHVMVHIPEPWLLVNKTPEDQEKYLIREARDIEDQIKRHVDADGTSINIERAYICSHCGYSWNEDSETFNGGCCDEDLKNAPEGFEL